MLEHTPGIPNILYFIDKNSKISFVAQFGSFSHSLKRSSQLSEKRDHTTKRTDILDIFVNGTVSGRPNELIKYVNLVTRINPKIYLKDHLRVFSMYKTLFKKLFSKESVNCIYQLWLTYFQKIEPQVLNLIIGWEYGSARMKAKDLQLLMLKAYDV
ncbi:hypothetical protein HanHA300_Chr04g0151281 [Helianthus annuus]|nr:hypothetical protein HanHA300_Chr04g0151281 [Helianthus annuus]KAJ0598326.1 hypothetical protein HanHA89_Chr04g0164561 [Helianthus annuus]